MYFKLNNPLNTALSKCSILLLLKSRYPRLFIFSNVPGNISFISLQFNDSLVNFVSPLNDPNFIVLSPQTVNFNSSSSVSEKKLSFDKNVMLFSSSKSVRTPEMWIKGTAVNDVLAQSTKYPPMSHLHSAGHSIATVAGQITKHNQYRRAGVANSSNTKVTISRDGMASCCDLQREREEMILNVTVFVVRAWGRAI
jgi:hypothetical protein